MRLVLPMITALSCALTVPAFGQSSVVLDWNAKPQPFSQADFEALVKCTLEKHPETTKRYATYHLLRRDKQTWQENEADPDSALLMPSLEGCFTFVNGAPMPFSLDALIARWGAAHQVLKQVP